MNAVPEPKRAVDVVIEMPTDLIPVGRPMNRIHLGISGLMVVFGAFLLLWSSGRNPDFSMVSPAGWWLSWPLMMTGFIWFVVTVERSARG